MADDVARRVLSDILVFQGVLLVVSQDDSAVEDDMKVSIVVKYDLSGLLLDDGQLRDQSPKLLVGAARFDQAPKEGLVLDVAHGSVRAPRKPCPLLVVQYGGQGLVELLIPVGIRICDANAVKELLDVVLYNLPVDLQRQH